MPSRPALSKKCYPPLVSPTTDDSYRSREKREAMIRGLPHPFDPVKRAGKKSKSEGEEATESDPLISSVQGERASGRLHGGSVRARRSSRSPKTIDTPMDQLQQKRGYDQQGGSRQAEGYSYLENASQGSSYTYTGGSISTNQHQGTIFTQQYPHELSPEEPDTTDSRIYGQATVRPGPLQPSGGTAHPPLLEIPEEVYAVRKAALQVLKPLTSSWLVISVGFAISALLGMARWSKLLPDLPFWFILMPSWCSHVGLLWCHIRSAQALSRFISQANENRQRPDSTDHIDRTEYLPLLQRSLKFGLKTGVLSLCTFLFEVLLYFRIAKSNIGLGSCFIPLWIIVISAILDGIVCKGQSFIRLLSWMLIFSSMVMAVLRIDYGILELTWPIVVGPFVAVLSFASLSLIYIVYGHQVGYYRLTESQLTAGILYSMSALIMIVLVVVIAEVMPLPRPVEIETRIFVVIMAPLVICLTGMGAYAVSRDEFGRLLLYGGQAAVHPMKLRWERRGWTSVPSKGVTVIPMFGEVSYRPLQKSPDSIELCTCCSCYPYEVQDEVIEYEDGGAWHNHPYLHHSSDVGHAVNL